MNLKDLGYNVSLEKYRKEKNLLNFDIGRVISEHKERYIVKTEDDDFEAEIIGNLRFSAKNRTDFPAVGDWVAISEFDKNKGLIHNVFPRKSIIEREAVGKSGEKQIIAANIDYALIIQAVDRDFNINRIERYLTICNASGIKSIIILNKTDLINDVRLKEILNLLTQRIINIPIVSISNETEDGYEDLLKYIHKGKTYCMLGSSGVGKSTLLNNISGKSHMKTDNISISTNKGRHVTSHRELVILDNGGILIDNPGMREVGIADSTGGLEITFNEIHSLSQNCRFKNCNHINEKGCAILEAVENRDIDKDTYENYLKLVREKTHYESTVAEKRKKDKNFGKMVKNFKKIKGLNKY